VELHGQKVICRLIKRPSEQQSLEIISLYRNQGWWQASDDGQNDLLHRLIAGSHAFVIAVWEGAVVGIGRALSDGVSDAYIQDLTVSSSFRRQGIGRMILKTLLEQLSEDGISWIGLIAEPGSAQFYQTFDFTEMPGSIPMLMVRKS
jgi:spermidine synthase